MAWWGTVKLELGDESGTLSYQEEETARAKAGRWEGPGEFEEAAGCGLR